MRLYSVGNSVGHSIFVGHSYEDLIRDALPKWGYPNKSVCHNRGEYSHDEDGDGFHEIHVNTMEGFCSLLRFWLRPHQGISQQKPPFYQAFFEFVHNVRQRGRALLGFLFDTILQPEPSPQNTI